MIKAAKKAGALLERRPLCSPRRLPRRRAQSERRLSAAPENAVSRPISITFPKAAAADRPRPRRDRPQIRPEVTDGDDGACTILMTAEEQAAVCAALREALTNSSSPCRRAARGL